MKRSGIEVGHGAMKEADAEVRHASSLKHRRERGLFMSFFELVRENGVYLVTAMGKTLELTFLSLVFAALIGLFFGLLNVSKNRALNVIANVYID